MKQLSIVILLLTVNCLFGQVGINTKTPTRTLHVEGNLKISDIHNASEDAIYSRILVANTGGDVDYASKSSFLPDVGAGASDKESYSEIYNNTNGGGIPTRKLKCGKFFFTFDDNVNDSNIMFGLNDKPAANVDVYMNMEQNWNGNGFQFYQGTNSTNGPNAPFTFTTTNYMNAQMFKSARLDPYEQNVMIFQYPGDADLYRLTIYKVKHASNSFDFVSACEKF
ncbi:hypothetical protein [Soonwooa sp.]|uniref:hypothetical protein n=1 Tax=Soonwooa sp. TaxID=1938592 RepID=UPI002629DAB5|nr:hypothetical protein [Soonwooa sp.]